MTVPEGHTIHRAARLQSKRLIGPPLAVWSPQGRFTEGAEKLDGGRIEEIRALGKHLFYRWDNDLILHVHLGLFGRFRLHGKEAPGPSSGTRVAIAHPEGTLYVSGPTTCDVIDPASMEAVVERLGPDPLSGPCEGCPDRISRSLDRRTVPIGTALMDQRVIAGIGNVYRAEILFLAGIEPHRRSSEVGDDVERLWWIAVRELRRGERSGRIVTVSPDDLGVDRRSDIPRDERLYVYKRGGRPCRRCGTPIAQDEMGGRSIWWCPVCQPS